MIKNIIIEICAGSFADALRASGFAEVDRIEFNSALELGGLTPSLSSFLAIRKKTDKTIIPMVRNRGAGFIYTQDEKNIMYEDAKLFLENGADGIVFGSLNEDHTVDQEFTRRMCNLIHSYGKTAVFHKAFDDAEDPYEAIEALIACGANRILTSGKETDALKGAPLIRELIDTYGTKIEILPGGGVSEDNAAEILNLTKAGQIHMSAKETIEQDGQYFAVSSSRIRKILSHI